MVEGEVPAVHIGIGYLVDIPGLAHETYRIRECFMKSQKDLELRRSDVEVDRNPHT